MLSPIENALDEIAKLVSRNSQLEKILINRNKLVSSPHPSVQTNQLATWRGNFSSNPELMESSSTEPAIVVVTIKASIWTSSRNSCSSPPSRNTNNLTDGLQQPRLVTGAKLVMNSLC